jgi:hypothetical protein
MHCAAGRGIPSQRAAIIARLTMMRSKHPVASLSNIMRLVGSLSNRRLGSSDGQD